MVSVTASVSKGSEQLCVINGKQLVLDLEQG